MLLQGTEGGNLDIFAASDASTAWVILWKTRSRPIGVRVRPVAQFSFFSTAFDPRVWTMVVFWKENSGHQPRLIIPENEGGDETNYPSLPSNFHFLISLMILTFPLVHEVHHFLNLRHLPDLRQGGLQLHHLLVVERARTGDTPRERLHPRSEQQEPQLIPIPMSDGDDD